MTSNHESFFKRFVASGRKLFQLRSIKGRIFTLFAISLLSIAALTVMNFWNLSTLRTRLLLSERYDDLFNNILEVRRFEKNFLIYGDTQSLVESLGYLDRIDTLVGELADDLRILSGQQALVTFQQTLGKYRDLVVQTGRGEQIDPGVLRNIGKTLTVSAGQFRDSKRKRIHGSITWTSMLPFAFFCILLPLMSLVIWLISYGLLRPLNLITETTQQVGRGDFRPIHYAGVRLEEISGLIDAFNSMARELEANQEDLVQARKIAAIGTFTAGIAHELNNPINNIVLTAEIFAEEYHEDMDSNCQEMIRDIISQAERAAEIVKSLLDFSRTEGPAFTKLAPELIVGSSIKLVQNQMKMEKVNLTTTLPPNLPPVRGNLGNLQQVFTNLLMNALQASPQGGQISMHAVRSDDPEFVEFVVEDNGPGIPREVQHKIFEPFFSTKEVGKGTGLGLSVCYSIIKRHGGMIKLASGEGKGTRFTVLLPVFHEPRKDDFVEWTAS